MSFLTLLLRPASYLLVYLIPALLSAKTLLHCAASLSPPSPPPSFSAVQTRHVQHWLTYWSCVLLLSLASPLLDCLSPYPLLLPRTLLCLYLSLPATLGSQRLYSLLILPLWSAHSAAVDERVSSLKSSVLRAFLRALSGMLTGGFSSLLSRQPSPPAPAPALTKARTSLADLRAASSSPSSPSLFLSTFRSLLADGLYVFARPPGAASLRLLVFGLGEGGGSVALTELPDERVLEIGIGDLEGVEAEGEAGVRIRWRGGGRGGWRSSSRRRGSGTSSWTGFSR